MVRSCLAVVPARGGSKGVKNKNIRRLLGKPLISYTIEEAKKCKAIGRIVVSTDSCRIRDVAVKCGAHAPFLRPGSLAKDSTAMYPVIAHAVRLMEAAGEKFQIILILQPTSPLRKASDIEKAIKILTKTGADSVVGVCASEHSPFWMRSVKRGRVYPLMKGTEYARRQDLPKAYRVNGAMYATKRDVLLRQKRILGRDTRALIMPAERSVDIDTNADFKLAESVLRRRKT
jgi:CMP-N-acetylneuraminic acid synthetase